MHMIVMYFRINQSINLVSLNSRYLVRFSFRSGHIRVNGDDATNVLSLLTKLLLDDFLLSPTSIDFDTDGDDMGDDSFMLTIDIYIIYILVVINQGAGRRRRRRRVLKKRSAESAVISQLHCYSQLSHVCMYVRMNRYMYLCLHTLAFVSYTYINCAQASPSYIQIKFRGGSEDPI